jgi:hypothetical protein
MSTVELRKVDADSPNWSGRTEMSGSLMDLKSALLRAGDADEAKLLGAATVLNWTDSFEDYPPERSDDVELTRVGPAGETVRWTPPPPDKPQFTPPLPFDFFLPRTAAPLDALAPWWDEVALGATTSTDPIAALHGKRLGAGPWPPDGERWRSHPASKFCKTSTLNLFADRLEARAGLESTTASISDPGLVGSLVPGYGELKEFASLISQRMEFMEVGCRISLGWISALSYESVWSWGAPLLGFKYKRLVRERGYGEHDRAAVGIELTDGWRPYRVRLTSELLPVEREEEPFEFFKSLVSAVVTDRLQRLDLTEEQRRQLTKAAESEPNLHESKVPAKRSMNAMGHVSRETRIELPGHQPVSVPLP